VQRSVVGHCRNHPTKNHKREGVHQKAEQVMRKIIGQKNKDKPREEYLS